MTAQACDTITASAAATLTAAGASSTAVGSCAASRPVRRADAGVIRLTRPDIDGLLLRGEHYGAPYDLPAFALLSKPPR
jgi:hypothetical protein